MKIRLFCLAVVALTTIVALSACEGRADPTATIEEPTAPIEEPTARMEEPTAQIVESTAQIVEPTVQMEGPALTMQEYADAMAALHEEWEQGVAERNDETSRKALGLSREIELIMERETTEAERLDIFERSEDENLTGEEFFALLPLRWQDLINGQVDVWVSLADQYMDSLIQTRLAYREEVNALRPPSEIADLHGQWIRVNEEIIPGFEGFEEWISAIREGDGAVGLILSFDDPSGLVAIYFASDALGGYLEKSRDACKALEEALEAELANRDIC